MIEDDRLRAPVRTIARKMTRKGLMLATAESCTGGWIAKVLTDQAGSSAWFAGGVVSYSDHAKMKLLGVRAQTLSEEGAVSEATVREMAAGALRRFDAEVAVAVSGVAGPDGGTPGKPVGTVWIAWAGPGVLKAQHHLFAGDREAVRKETVRAALEGLVGL